MTRDPGPLDALRLRRALAERRDRAVRRRQRLARLLVADAGCSARAHVLQAAARQR